MLKNERREVRKNRARRKNELKSNRKALRIIEEQIHGWNKKDRKKEERIYEEFSKAHLPKS